MAEPKPKSTGKTIPIADVARPGKSVPADNSKSVIVPNRPMVKDPMVVENAAEAESPPEPSPKLFAKAERKLQPLEQPAADTDLPAADKQDAADEKQPAEADKSEASQPAEPAETAPAGDEAPADKEEPNKDAKKAAEADEAKAAEAAKHQAAVDKLADSKQYYLPINTVEKRRSRRFVLLGVLLSLVLLIAWGDVAIDAGLINSNGLPHTHFFDQQTVTPAAATASPTFKSFTALFSQLTFRYPSDWELISRGSTKTLDIASLNPSQKTDPNSGIAVVFESPSPEPSQGSFTVEYVHYQKLPHKIGGAVYLRDLVCQSQNGKTTHIIVRSSLTNDNTESVGQQLTSIEQSFQNPDGQSSSEFGITAFPMFASVDEAKQFIQSSDYQLARAILLSTMPAKH
jgi:hypothetical protein